MSANSKIEWTDHTFNPWIGCTKVSPGCEHCYAETLMDTRYKRVKWGKGQPRQRTSAANWREPVKWNREADEAIARIKADIGNASEYQAVDYERPRVFCASLADWLDDEVPIQWLADLLALIHATPNLDWLLLTKRPQLFFPRMQTAWRYMATAPRFETLGDAVWVREWEVGNAPPFNVWVGTTVEDQKRADERIPELLKIPARVRFLSCEPLLGPVELSNATHRKDCVSRLGKPALEGIHWVIAGGESGPGARPMDPEWARSLRGQCKAAQIPFFFKQWGEWAPKPPNLHETDDERFDDAPFGEFHGDGSFIEGCLCDDGEEQVYRVGQKAAGRLLDGEEWSQFPAVS